MVVRLLVRQSRRGPRNAVDFMGTSRLHLTVQHTCPIKVAAVDRASPFQRTMESVGQSEPFPAPPLAKVIHRLALLPTEQSISVLLMETVIRKLQSRMIREPVGPRSAATRISSTLAFRLAFRTPSLQRWLPAIQTALPLHFTAHRQPDRFRMPVSTACGICTGRRHTMAARRGQLSKPHLILRSVDASGSAAEATIAETCSILWMPRSTR